MHHVSTRIKPTTRAEHPVLAMISPQVGIHCHLLSHASVASPFIPSLPDHSTVSFLPLFFFFFAHVLSTWDFCLSLLFSWNPKILSLTYLGSLQCVRCLCWEGRNSKRKMTWLWFEWVAPRVKSEEWTVQPKAWIQAGTMNLSGKDGHEKNR